MGATSYVHALIAIIADVIDSLDVAIGTATATEALTSANDAKTKGGALELASSLKENVECILDTLDSGSECVNKEVLEALNDSIECCRLLASAISPRPPSETERDAARSTASSRRKPGGGTIQIAKRVLESMQFLCDITHCKESSVEQRTLRKRTRVVRGDYQSLTLLLHYRLKDKDQGHWGARRASFPGLSGPAQLSSKLRETRASLESLSCSGVASPEAQKSRSIDRQLHEERLQPWIRSDCVMLPQPLQLVGLFKPSLAAFTSEDRQQHMADLRREVVRHIRRFLDDEKCWDETFMPVEAFLLAAELRTRVEETSDTLTDEELYLYERLWSFESFTSIANDIEGGSWVDDTSLLISVLGKVREIMRDDNYVLTVGDAVFALRRVAFAHVNHFTYGGRQVNIVDPRSNPSLAKRWRQHFGWTPTLIALFDLSTYDKVYPEFPDFTFFGEYLDFFDCMTKEPCFEDTTFLLYLVNVTKFREKVKRVPMADYMPSFVGGNDPDKAALYILRQFTSRVEGRHRVRVRICDFMDPLNVDFLFTSVDHAVRQRQIVKRLRGYDPAVPNA